VPRDRPFPRLRFLRRPSDPCGDDGLSEERAGPPGPPLPRAPRLVPRLHRANRAGAPGRRDDPDRDLLRGPGSPRRALPGADRPGPLPAPGDDHRDGSSPGADRRRRHDPRRPKPPFRGGPLHPGGPAAGPGISPGPRRPQSPRGRGGLPDPPRGSARGSEVADHPVAPGGGAAPHRARRVQHDPVSAESRGGAGLDRDGPGAGAPARYPSLVPPGSSARGRRPKGWPRT